MKALALAGSILLIACAFAQRAPQAKPEIPEEAKCTLEGHVQRISGEPLKKASVILRSAEGREPVFGTMTDATGKFLLKGVPPGRFRMTVERQGYVQQEYGQSAPGRQGSILTLSPGARMRDLLFRMLPAAVIAGRVFDEDGEPLQDVRIQLLRYVYAQGRRQLRPAGGAATNDLGEYRLSGLAPGRYYVSATDTPGVRYLGDEVTILNAQPGGEESYPPVYYPGTSDPARAAALEARAGEELRGIDFAFLPARAYRVRGKVFNAITGKPGNEVQVLLAPKDGGVALFFMQNRTFVDNAEGTFELRNVLPGEYVLHAFWHHENRSYPARMTVDVGAADVDGVTVTIRPGTEVSGKIRVESGELEMGRLQAYLQPPEPFFLGGIPAGPVKEDGTFVIPNVGEGPYDFQISRLPHGFYLKSVRFGTQDVLEQGLTIGKGKISASLDAVVSGAGGRLEGQVTNEDDLPVSGAVVVLVPEPRRRDRAMFYLSTTTDQFGRFALMGIRPAEYKVFAWEEIERGIYQDPDFLRLYESKGKALQVAESSTQTIELKAISANRVGR